MTSLLMTRRVLEDLDGFDESIDYGEDGDLPKRAREKGFEKGDSGAVIYYRFVSSSSEVFRQGRWYGKSMLNYLKKYPEEFPTLLMLGYFVTWPLITVLGLLNAYIGYLAVLQNIGVLLYLLIGFYNSRSPYIVFVPFVKSVRGYGEMLGLVESRFSSDIGRD